MSKVTEWAAEQAAKLDPEGLGRTGVALLLMTPDLGHAGKLFAVREAADRGIIGYLMAFGVDVTFWFAFREAGKVKRMTRRGFAVFVALLACSINGAFNVAYYRDNAAADPFWVSLVLGASAPTLAALLSVMQAFRQVEQAERAEAKEDQQAERIFELEKLRIQAEAGAKVAVEAERTKQVRAQVRAERAKVEAQAQETAETARQDAEAETKPRATATDWRAIYVGMNGNRADLDADTVAAMVEAAGFSLPSRRSLQNWAREAQASAQPAPAPQQGRAVGAEEEER